MTTTYTQDAKTETYHEVEAMINKLAWKYGGNDQGHDDYMSIGNEAFLKAYTSYDPSRGQFITHAWTCVRNEMSKYYHSQKGYREHHRTNTINGRIHDEEEMPTAEPTDRPRNRIAALMDDLSDDARQIVTMVIEGPAEIASLLRIRDPQKVRTGLWKYLKSLGWSLGRVSNAYDEIRDTIS